MLGRVTLMGEIAPPGSPGSALVGRAAELQVVGTAIAGLTVGRGGALALVGPAGVGKSRLAREAAALATGNDVAVLTGRAVATGGSTPYRPLI